MEYEPAVITRRGGAAPKGGGRSGYEKSEIEIESL